MKEFAPEAAELLYVGKRGGQPSIIQAEIDEILVDHCRQVCSYPVSASCNSVLSI